VRSISRDDVVLRREAERNPDSVQAFAVAVFVHEKLRLAEVPRVLPSSGCQVAMLLYILTDATNAEAARDVASASGAGCERNGPRA
jgi:hypothetical protein